MSTFEQIIKVVLAHEGGYVNDPKDAGGETKYGISKRAFPRVDIQNLTIENATALYRRHYWEPSKAEILPISLRAIHFDTAVNCGTATAIRLLQRAAKVNDDGIFGGVTAGAALNVPVEAYVKERIAYYERIVARRPDQKRFLKGWITRTNSFLPKK